MIVEPGQRAGAARRLADGAEVDEALQEVARAALVATGAEAVVIRAADEACTMLTARAVAASTESHAAELEGSRVPVDELGGDDGGALHLPVHVKGRLAGSVDLSRRGG